MNRIFYSIIFLLICTGSVTTTHERKFAERVLFGLATHNAYGLDKDRQEIPTARYDAEQLPRYHAAYFIRNAQANRNNLRLFNRAPQQQQNQNGQ